MARKHRDGIFSSYSQCALVCLLMLMLCLVWASTVSAQIAATNPSTEDLQREAAIAEFTKKTRAANYPALFDQAAEEFNVPADILKGVAFAETRWEHLTWPPGETVSPDNGMPRPYGIMSLWDNDHFGHSLIEAAALINKDQEVLKQDAFQNIRGAAALLRKIYDETERPAGESASDIESWRFAIRNYCGIPQPDLNARHALDVYSFMNQGYHRFGIEWNAHPVNLEPLRAETARIIAEEKANKLAASVNGNATLSPISSASTAVRQVAAFSSNSPASVSNQTTGSTNTPTKSGMKPTWILVSVGLLLAALLAVWLVGQNKNE